MKDILTGNRQAWRMLVGILAALPMLVLAIPMITVKVTVVASPPCVINGNRPIEVEFGDVMTTQVDGYNYKMPIEYTLSCSGTLPYALTLQLKGTGSEFDATVLMTDKAGLGIKLLQGSEQVAVNSTLVFIYGHNPLLWAVPVKKGGATLTGGEFRAGAIMGVNYL
ncbi:MAG: fimbrial protein [Hafnia sp.]